LNFSRIFLKAKFGEILNTKVAPKIMLINSRLFKHYSQTNFITLASKCNNYVSNRCFSHFKLVLTYIACDYKMHVMLMLILWDVNACLTPRGVATRGARV
jgi:hypothetical protein